MSGDLTQKMIHAYRKLEVDAAGSPGWPAHPDVAEVMGALARVVREHVAGEIEAYRERVVPRAPSDDDYADALTVAAQVARGTPTPSSAWRSVGGSLGEQWERVHPVHEAGSGPGG